MFGWSKLALVAILGLAACGSAAGPPGSPEPVDLRVAVILAALDGALEARSDRSDLFVDPALLASVSERMPPSASQQSGVPPDVNRDFKAAVHSRHLETLSAFAWSDGCSGILVAPSSKVLDKCPDEPTVILAFGLPKRESDRLWEVPMFEAGYLDRGSTGTVYTIEVREVGSRLVYAGEVAVLAID